MKLLMYLAFVAFLAVSFGIFHLVKGPGMIDIAPQPHTYSMSIQEFQECVSCNDDCQARINFDVCLSRLSLKTSHSWPLFKNRTIPYLAILFFSIWVVVYYALYLDRTIESVRKQFKELKELKQVEDFEAYVMIQNALRAQMREYFAKCHGKYFDEAMFLGKLSERLRELRKKQIRINCFTAQF